MATDTEKLVQMITAQVLSRLNQPMAGQKNSSEQAKPAFKALAVFTGGTIGLIEGLAAVREMAGWPAEITVVLSPAAEKVIGADRVKDSLGPLCPILTAADPYPGKILRAAHLMIVPVLTQNTMTKLALTLSDTLPSTLIMQALMMGKPVIAARNGADPQDNWRAKADMGQPAPGLMRVLQNNMRQVEAFGVQLADVRDLAAEARKVYKAYDKHAAQAAGGDSPGRREAASQGGGKTIISAETIKAAALEGCRSYQVGRGTILTPLARDIAREYGVEIVETL